MARTVAPLPAGSRITDYIGLGVIAKYFLLGFFPSYKLWRAAAHSGADLLWRTRQNASLDVDQRLPDGSYLSRIYASTSDRRNQHKGIVVRAIDYRLKDVQDAEPIYRLITTILDPKGVLGVAHGPLCCYSPLGTGKSRMRRSSTRSCKSVSHRAEIGSTLEG